MKSGLIVMPSCCKIKAIIKFINEIAKLIEADEEVKDKLKVVFVHNYNVSYAENIPVPSSSKVPSTNVSKTCLILGFS